MPRQSECFSFFPEGNYTKNNNEVEINQICETVEEEEDLNLEQDSENQEENLLPIDDESRKILLQKLEKKKIKIGVLKV